MTNAEKLTSLYTDSINNTKNNVVQKTVVQLLATPDPPLPWPPPDYQVPQVIPIPVVNPPANPPLIQLNVNAAPFIPANLPNQPPPRNDGNNAIGVPNVL